MTEPQTAAERRAQITAQIVAQTGIDDAMIEQLVRRFYAKIRADALLGPIFETRIQDWEPHLQRMCAFWSSVALMSGRYHGNPMAKHLQLPVDAVHFDRWIELFELAAREICPPAAEAHFIERARRIAESLELGIAGRHDVLLGSGQRYTNHSCATTMKESRDDQSSPAYVPKRSDCRSDCGDDTWFDHGISQI